jgi:hypothetical protein
MLFPRTLAAALVVFSSLLAQRHRAHTGSFETEGTIKWKLLSKRPFNKPETGSRVELLTGLAFFTGGVSSEVAEVEITSNWRFLLKSLFGIIPNHAITMRYQNSY